MMTPQSVLRDYFGYSTFRGGQETLIRHILAGGDVLGIMPTGAGKSVCYQVPAMMMQGMTIVVSPLISLMQDQVTALRAAGIPAECLNSNLTQAEYFAALDAVRAGEVKLLYAAPERLLTDAFLSLAQQIPITMVAVDEAHCLSQWGQDFRPHYLEIADFLAKLPRRPVVAAFTATATQTVRDDIRRLLGLRDPLELVTGFDRDNLRWIVERPERPSKKYDALLRILRERKGKSGIIYCLTRKTTDEVCEKLRADGFSCVNYHAGLSAEERAAHQDAFIRDEVPLITATNAFGMGIDKSNVSFVVHYNMPKSMEAYYQEAGRAGRDGMPADCILLYSGQDIRLNQFLIEHSDSENERLTPEQRETVRQRDVERLNVMVRYCNLTDCLRHDILRYFGEDSPRHCGNCSSCLSGAETADATLEAQKILSCVYRMDQRGVHGGVRLLCDTLQAKETKQITALRLSELTTYGIMRDTPRKTLEQMVNILISRGFLNVESGMYPTLALTARANPVLRGQERVEMALPAQRQKQPETLGAVPEFTGGEALFERLKKVRSRLAAKEYVPPYIIFNNATLQAMSERMPATESAMLEIPGVGRHKMEKYGDAFLQAIRDYRAEQAG